MFKLSLQYKIIGDNVQLAVTTNAKKQFVIGIKENYFKNI